MGGQDREVGEHVRHPAGRRGEAQQHGRIVRRLDRVEPGELRGARIPGGRVPGRGERPGDVARRRGHAVVPAQAAHQPEGERPPVGRPGPAPRQVGPRDEGGVVADQRRQQHVALDLAGERMEREQGIDALQIRTGGEENRGAAAGRRRLAGETRRERERKSETPEHGERYRTPAPRGQISGVATGASEDCTMLPLARRALAGLGVVLGVVTLMFGLLRLAPGDPALLLVGPAATTEQIEAQRHALGLDRPLAAQYTTWLGRFVRGDWGTSIATGRPVRAMLGRGVARHRAPGGDLAGAELSARHHHRRGAGGPRRPAGHPALDRHRHPVRPARLLAGPHAGHAVHLPIAAAARVRRRGVRRRLPFRPRAPGRSAAPPRVAARDAHPDRNRRHRAVRPRGDARRGRGAVCRRGSLERAQPGAR